MLTKVVLTARNGSACIHARNFTHQCVKRNELKTSRIEARINYREAAIKCRLSLTIRRELLINMVKQSTFCQAMCRVK